ncbi:hypothetical protein C8F01DRAFT_1377377 [Mycena amicta]|nr:hypothetical protein C8F01DRAFT_1377377 [Mycena amicta]
MDILSESPSDVVLLILAFCDVASVLAVSQTCKRLHTLVFEKSVWISLCRDLQHRQMLDCVLTPELSGPSLTTTELIGLIKRIVSGPDSWKTGRAPTIQREITLPLQAQAQGSRTSHGYSRDEVQLLPDGRHLLFNQSGTLTCWDVVSQNRIWKHVPSADPARSFVVHVAAAKVSRDVLRILAANHVVASGGGDSSNYVEIIELDLQTGIDRLLLVTRIWGKSPVDPFESGVISGTGPVAAISFTTYYSTSGAIFFDFTSVDEPKVLQIQCYAYAVGLTERHIYVGCDQKSESNIQSNKKSRWASLRVLRFDVLADFCGPAYPALGSETPRSILLDHLPGIAALNLGPLPVRAISVLASPLRDHHYRVWIHTLTGVNLDGPGSTSLYRLVDSDSHLLLEKLQSYEHEERVHLNSDSVYSGHALFGGRPPDLQAYLLMPSSRRYVLNLLNANIDRSWWRMSSYSGAVAYFARTFNSIVVKYYE